MQTVSVSRPSLLSRGCVKCKPANLRRKVVMHAQTERNCAKDLTNVLLGFSMTATFSFMTSCGSVQAADYADEMFKIVQERSGKEFGMDTLEIKEAPVVSQREKRMQKLLSEDGALQQEKSQKKVVEEQKPVAKPSLEDVKLLKTQLQEETTQTTEATPTPAPAAAPTPTPAPAPVITPKAAPVQTTPASAPVITPKTAPVQTKTETVSKVETKATATTSSSPFAKEDGTFKSASQVQTGGAIAATAVIGGVLFTNMKTKTTATAAATATATSAPTTTIPQNGVVDSVKDAEAWVANWKASSTSPVEEAEAWVASWKAKSSK